MSEATTEETVRQRRRRLRTTLHVAFKARLRQLRAASGLRPSAIARECGISLSHYYELENGNSCPNLTTVYGLARAMGLKPADLLPDAEGGS